MIDTVQRKYVWDRLSRDTQDAYIRILWNDGYSEGAIATFFDVGKGVIVRRRQSYVQGLKASNERTKVKSHLTLDRFEDLIELARMHEIEEETGVAIATSISNVTTCQWPLATGGTVREPMLCGKPVIPGHKVCATHFPLLKRPKRHAR